MAADFLLGIYLPINCDGCGRSRCSVLLEKDVVSTGVRARNK